MVRKRRCRICESTEDLIMIFTKENQEILRMLESIAAAPIMKNDYLPQHICPKCSNDLKATYSFKMLYAMTSTKMKDMLISPKRCEGEIPSNICDLKSEEATDGISTKPQSDQSESCFEVLIMRSEEKDDDNEPLGDIELTELDVCGYKICLEIETYSRDNQEDCLKKETSKKTQEDLTNATTASDTKIIEKVQSIHFQSNEDHFDNTISLESRATSKIHSKDDLKPCLHKCHYCHKSVSLLRNLRYHEILHKNPELYKCICNECGKSFAALEKLKLRTAWHENPDINKSNEYGKTLSSAHSLKQQICGQSFSTAQILQAHEALHKNPNSYTCSVCSKIFTVEHPLRWHKILNSDSIKCNDCAKSFGTFDSLRAREALHKKPNIYKCDKCKRSYKSEKYLKIHYFRHSYAHKCKKCDKSFYSLKSLKLHEAWHKHPNLYQCNECGESFDKLHSFAAHCALHKDPIIYKCDLCEKTFAKEHSLMLHQVCHCDFNQCNECGKTFRTLQSLITHEALHKNPDLYKCNECGKTFNSDRYLAKHTVSHSRLIKCNECDKSFATLDSLKLHAVSHTNPDQLKCDQCGKSFTLAASLKKHKILHSDLTKCKKCGKSFDNLRKLKLHMAMHENSDLDKCDKCAIAYKNKFRFKQHMLSHSDC